MDSNLGREIAQAQCFHETRTQYPLYARKPFWFLAFTAGNAPSASGDCQNFQKQAFD
jgi:hypothetical protein